MLYTDAGGVLGARIGEFPVASVTPGVWSGYFAYHNYGSLDPNETAIIITKGRTYWLAVEPLSDMSLVYWAASLSTKPTKQFRNGVYTLGTNYTAKTFTVAVFEPYPPQVQSPGVPLVEGEQVPAETVGVTLSSVGTIPQTPCLGSILVNKKKIPAILGADGKVKLRIGDAAPTLAGTAIAKLGEPSGDVVLATLKRQTATPGPLVTAANDIVLIGGVLTPPLRIVARSGEAITGGGGAVIAKFLSLDGGGTSPFFTVTLAGTGVATKNNTALAGANGNAAAKVLVRRDDTVGTAKVTIIGTLLGFAESIGEGRWRAGDGAIGVRLTLSDKSNHLFTIPATAASQLDWLPWAATGVPLPAPLAGAVIKSIGAPGFGPDGVVFPATLQIGPGGVTTANDLAILQQTAGGLDILAREGGDVPDAEGAAIADAKFKTFGNPVYGPAGVTAFTAKLTAKTNTSGIWWVDGVNPLLLVARAGDPAPTFGTFSKFTNLILPNTAGSAPVFEAKLASQAAASVTGATSDGIWAVNNAGDVTLVARNGNYIFLNGNLYGTISAISALATPATSTGAAHGVDTNGSVRINATIANRAAPGKKRAQFPVPIPQP